MRSFLKFFLASLAALVVFFGLALLVLFGIAGSLVSRDISVVPSRSVLVVDLSRHFRDLKEENLLLELSGDEEDDVPSLAQLIRVIEHARGDSSIRGIYLVAN